VAAALLYLFLCLVWGSTWLVIRIGLADLSPFWSLVIRIVPALLFILLLAWIQRASWSELREQRSKVLRLGLLVYPVGYGLVYWGEQYVTSGLSAVMFSAMPFFVALLSLRLLPGERLTRPKAAGLVLGLMGLVTVYWDQLGLGDTLHLLGMAAITLSALVSAYTTILIRRDLGRVPPVVLTASTLIVGAIIVPGYALGLEGPATFHLTSRALASAAYLSVVASGLAFVAYYRLLSQISALTMSLISFVTPIIALLLGALFDYEVLGRRAQAGIALVLVGVLLAVRGGRK
jgi:drug/metabolite transporter (DMT)-like permease